MHLINDVSVKKYKTKSDDDLQKTGLGEIKEMEMSIFEIHNYLVVCICIRICVCMNE